jgi:hypothetical protein
MEIPKWRPPKAPFNRRRVSVCLACRQVRVLEAYRIICEKCNTAKAPK